MKTKPPTRDRGAAGRSVIAGRSPLLLRFFGRLFERDLAATFHGVRSSGTLPAGTGPLLVFANHPSWWDGELFVWLTATVFAGRRGFAPVDAGMLERYRFFRKLGGFAVAPGYSGASAFITIGEAVLRLEDGLLLVNAEGRFRDVRARPLSIAPGIVHLARIAPAARFVPLAIEYAFWDERRANVLLRFGEAISADMVRASPGVLQKSLKETMDLLAADAITRDPALFKTLLAGTAKINVFYDAWRRGKALMRGKSFDPAHNAETGSP